VASTPSIESITFGEFEAKQASRELCRNGVRVRLPDQSFHVLSMLLERPGNLVTREEIRQRLWPEGTFVDFDHGLNNAVNRLREALRDSAEEPRFIETLPRRGYRFIAQVQLNVRSTTELPANAPRKIRGFDGQEPKTTYRKSVSRRRALLASVVVFLLVALAIGVYRAKVTARASQVESIAVLPLQNVSGDAGQEYFADGMTDALITKLARLDSLRVISRTSVMHYKGSPKTLREIAQELGVDAIVEGTISKSGSRVRINAQLIDAAKDQHLWAQQYDGELKDILQLQNDLASAITAEIAGKLTAKQRSRLLVRSRPVNPQAFDALLRGEYFLDKWSVDGFAKAKEYFEQSIHLDPTYADAYAGLGEYYGTVAFMGIVPPGNAWLKSEELLSKSLELDNTSSKAHSLLGMLKLQFRCDRASAEKELNYALELNPGDMRALDYHSYYLLEIGRTDEAIAEKKRVLQHDPMRVISNAELGLYFYQAGRTDEAIEQLQKTLELDPNYAPTHARLGMAYRKKGQYEHAVTEMQKALSLDEKPDRIARLGVVYAQWGKRKEAMEAIHQLGMSKGYVSPTSKALIYTQLGERDSAFRWLEKAKPEDEPKISDPDFASLRSDPRFKRLEERQRPNQSCPAF
jgi:TolB-like protein/DNA-binding winged helix-turn-helix (wHTH) protein/Tfp pilus assembly protein PilF